MLALCLAFNLALGIVGGQEFPLGAAAGLDFTFGGAWLRAGQFSRDARARLGPQEDSTANIKTYAPEASGRGPAARAARRAFAVDPACNFTSCCYLASSSHTAALGASSLSGALACGGATPDGSTAPCHIPVAAHTPLLLALRTRMQLSLHALSSQLDRLVASRPRAWLEQQLAELQQLLRPAVGRGRLALGPAQSAWTGLQAGAEAGGSGEPSGLHTAGGQGQGPDGPVRAVQDRTEGEGGAGHGSDDALDGLAAELALQGASAEALARLRRLVRARADYAERARAAADATAAAAAAESTMAAAAEAILASARTSGGPATAAKPLTTDAAPKAAARAGANVAFTGSARGAPPRPRTEASDVAPEQVAAKPQRDAALDSTLAQSGTPLLVELTGETVATGSGGASMEASGARAATGFGPLANASGSSAAAGSQLSGGQAQAGAATCVCPAESSSGREQSSGEVPPRRSHEAESGQLLKLLVGMSAGALCCAALAVRSSLAATEARRREAAEAAGRLEGVIEGNRRQAEALAAEYEAQLAALQARHAAEAEQLQSALSSLQLEVQQLQTSRDKCVRLAAASQRLGATAVVHLAAAVPALQQRQVMLSEALTTTVAGWKRQGAAAMAALARCKAEVVELRQRAAKQQEAAEVEVRRAVEAAAEAAQLVAATHEDQVENLTRRFQEELEGERRRRAADQWAAREAAEAAAAELAALRRRHGANLRSWLALKGWVALKMTDVAERAGRLAAEHRAQAASARATVQDLQAQLGAARAQLAAQVRAAVEARGAVSELTELLAGKDADILELEGRLGGAEAALESQRQQAGALAAALTATEESLAAARADSEQLSTALRNAQVATAAAEGRAAELLSANQLLDTQVKQFTDMTADLARIQETYVAPHQARVAALEAQVEHERAVAAAAAAERANELAAMSEDLAEARRESESLRRARAELADRLERRERELGALQAELAELSQREEEGLENALCAVRQRDREHQAALQQLLLPLPADTKATMLAQAASAGCATPSSCGAGGGVPAALMSGGFATPLTGGSGMGAGGGSSASGVRGALGLGSSSMTKR